MQPYLNRLQQLQKHLTAHQAMVLADPAALGYLTGFRILTSNEREGYLLITPQTITLCATAFSPLPDYLDTAVLPTGMAVQRTTQPLAIASLLVQQQVNEVFLDEQVLTIAELHALQHHLTQLQASVKLSTFDPQLLWQQRMKKDAAEVESLRVAGRIVHQALTETLAQLRVGQSEYQIALELEHRFRQLGAEGAAFPTIVAFGAHAAAPHHQPSASTQLSDNTLVLIDCGARYQGYNSDITRTVWFGTTPSARFQQIKSIVDGASVVGQDLITARLRQKQPLTAKELDTTVRQAIERAGYGPQFIHTTGHGIGWEVHEPPSLYQTNPTALAAGMVVTIEPGIYLPGELGYRHEDTFLLTDQGLDVLTTSAELSPERQP